MLSVSSGYREAILLYRHGNTFSLVSDSRGSCNFAAILVILHVNVYVEGVFSPPYSKMYV